YVTVVDANHTVATNTSKIFVTVAPSSVNGTDVTVVYGEDIVVTVASENATAVIYNITNAAGVVVADTPMAANGTISGLGLAVGEYTVNYVTVVDANHTVATNTSKIIVTPAPSAVSAEDVEVTYGEPITVNVASENATGVTYVITGEGVELSGTVQDGVITIDKDYLLAGEYTVTLTTQVDANHTVATNTSKITVNRLSIIIETTTTISDASGKPGETVTLDVEVTTEDGTPFNGDVVITCPDGKKVTVTVKDGKGQFDWTIPEDANAGDEYQFTATFEGNSTYLASSGNGTVTVEEPEPKPEPPVPVPEPEPEEPEEPVVTPAKMLNTGNPLVALLAAFVLIGLGLKRREEE
ncbi:Ig-like domain repeat protein, partial [Methanobrevibacter ruminantium]|uniref:Ig-like domain repeat protein n=1 Tax=Methanobrevibacter ruminantium TaxID=83816 RepID=UPI0026EAB596